MDKSWFASASASASRYLPKSTHELPRWRSPSPMTASIIPPPIVASTYAASPQSPNLMARSVVPVGEERSPYQQRQDELEADLQFLLDVQVEGLMAGLDSGLPDDRTSTGSTTPTARSVRSSSARHAERPVRRKPGLKSARRGIYNSIYALAALKLEESDMLQAEIEDRRGTLEQIDGWEEKRRKLQEATQDVEDNEENIRTQRLHQEADELQSQINEVELQLMEMKSRHGKLVRQAQTVENAVQAKLASYTSSLSMLEADVKKFLARTPRIERSVSGSRSSSSDVKASLWQLAPKHRNLEMARGHWQSERDAIEQQREATEAEREALIEGGKLWKEVVVEVSELEKKLKTDMAGATSFESSDDAWDVSRPPQRDAAERMKDLLIQMDTVITSLGSKFELVQEKGWKLLIASIGAELEAFRQGKTMLEGVLTAATGPTTDGSAEQANGNALSEDHGQEIRELDEAFEASRIHGLSSRTSDTEDDPDPELLVSHQDGDAD